MKKIFKAIIALASLALFIPSISFASVSVGWNATSSTGGAISPTTVNAINYSLKIPSTGTSTYSGGIISPCFSTGTGCISSSAPTPPGGSPGSIQYNNSGSFAGTSSPTVNYVTATSSTDTSSFAGNGFFGGNLQVGQCVAGDTKIRRKKRKGKDKGIGFEDVSIDEIEEGDVIYTFDSKKGEFGLSIVKQVCFAGVRPVIEMKTSLGKKIKTTHEHPYFVRMGKTMKEGGWKAAGFLCVGNEIAVVGADGDAPAWDAIVSLKVLPAEDVFDIEVNEKHTFIGNGIVAHNTAFFADHTNKRIGIGNGAPKNAIDLLGSDGTISNIDNAGTSSINIIADDTSNGPPFNTTSVNITSENTQSGSGGFATMDLISVGYAGGSFQMCGEDDAFPTCMKIETVNNGSSPFMEMDAADDYFVNPNGFDQPAAVGINTTDPIFNSALDVEQGDVVIGNLTSAPLLGTDSVGRIIPITLIAVANGGTGTTATAQANKLLIGNSAGTGWTEIATSSLGITGSGTVYIRRNEQWLDRRHYHHFRHHRPQYRKSLV